MEECLGMISYIKDWILSCIFPDRRPVNLHNHKLKVIKRIGEGGFSFVYLVKSNSYKDEEDAVTSSAPQRPKSKGGSYLYALKRIKIQLEEQERSFEKELHYHKLIGLHPNVITLIDGELVHHGNGIKEGLLLFPFYKKGTWQDLINRSQLNGETVDLKRLMTLFTGVCNGLLAFHQQPTALAFRDLKPANILIDGTGQSVLMDLGSVQPARFEIRSRAEAVALQDLASETVTAPFRPPELFEVPSQAQLDERTDVWSLGCTLYAMITGSSPFDGSATSAMSGRLNFNLPAFSNYPHSVKTLISSMIVVDLKQRPFVTDILQQTKSLKLSYMALFDNVQLGDIVLFSDIYWITSLLTRFGTVSRWTHVAMVVGLPQSRRDDVLIFEISNTLVHPLYDHLSETYKKKGARVVSLRERLKQYPKHGESVMIMSLVNHRIPRPMISFYMESELIEILNCMKNVSFRDSWHLLIRAAISHNWRAFRPSAIRRDLKIIYELQYRKSTLFCSEALIIVLQELGILNRFCNPKRYVPADFGCRYYKDNVQPPLLPLKRGWNYTPLLCLRLKALR